MMTCAECFRPIRSWQVRVRSRERYYVAHRACWNRREVTVTQAAEVLGRAFVQVRPQDYAGRRNRL
jgi:hypothetical protein